MRDIGRNIKDLRIRRKMTQDELAEKLFVTRQTVSNYETGKSRPDIDMLMKIAEVLGTDIHQLLYGAIQPVEKQNIRRLVISGILTVIAGILFLIIRPYAQAIKARYFITGLNFTLFSFVLPLFFLFLGWTIAHLLGMALKKEPLSAPWAKYIRWLLLILTTAIFFITLSYLIPQLVGEYRFITFDAPSKSSADFIHIPEWAEYLFMNLLLRPLYAWRTSYSCAYTLPIGGLLWLFGFPPKKK